VVTYTGNGVSSSTARTARIPHSLGVTPGFVIIKRTDTTSEWIAAHHANGTTGKTLYLNLTNASVGDIAWSTYFDDTDFSINWSPEANFNVLNATYVAYIYAHDPLGPSGDGSDGLIACGSYVGNDSTGTHDGQIINLGWEPQYILIKESSDGGRAWEIVDTIRGIPTGGNASRLFPNIGNAESQSVIDAEVDSTGFVAKGYNINQDGRTYIYMAIRRGPMAVPESASEVFAIDTANATNPDYVSNFVTDMAIENDTDGFNHSINSRLTQGKYLRTNTADSEFTDANQAAYDFMNGFGQNFGSNDSTRLSYMFRRAPGFFDVVAYTGDGSTQNVTHNLGVTPEMIWVKRRSGTGSWMVYINAVPSINLSLNIVDFFSSSKRISTASDSTFTVVNSTEANSSGETYIAYLFATVPGVSKVGSFTTTGSDLNVDCGFTNGARFILLKKTSATQDWIVFDTERGIVAGNDPYLALNTTAAEVSNYDAIDPLSSGFTLVGSFWGSGSNYIFLAIA